jgi:glycosyltransferase involved in cell wall biosynthesis
MSAYSVVICTYNGEKFLREQLDSVLNQSVQANEILVVDDNSTDATFDILKTYVERFPQLKIHRNEKNLGVIKNFELALQLSTGDYIFIADQDDLWHPDKIESFERLIRKNRITPEDVCLVFSDLEVINSDRNQISDSFWKLNDFRFSEDPSELFANILFRNFVPGCSSMITKGLRNIARPFPRRISMHDHWLCLVAVAFGRVYRMPESLMKYRQHDQNVVGARNYQWYDKLKELVCSRNKFLERQKIKFEQYFELLKISSSRPVLNLKAFEEPMNAIGAGGMLGCKAAREAGLVPVSLRDKLLFYCSILCGFYRLNGDNYLESVQTKD